MCRTIKTIMTFVLLILANSCATEVNFVYKEAMPEFKINLSEEPQVCIAIMSKDVTGIDDLLKNDLKRFLGKTVYMHDVTDEIKLSGGRKIVINNKKITLKHPKTRYLIVFYQNEPQISHDFLRIDQIEAYKSSDGQIKTRDTGRDTLIYETNFSAMCETILFDLKNNNLIAKAVDQFTNKVQAQRTEKFSDQNLLGKVSKVLTDPKNDKDRYPVVSSVSAASKDNFFYTFLNNLTSN